MSIIKTNAAQIGQSATATNNFTLFQPTVPDGTVRLGVGNVGSVTDVVTFTSAGNVGIGTSSPAAKVEIAGGDLLYAAGVAAYSKRATAVSVAAGATVTLFDLWSGNQGRGQYLVSATRSGASTGIRNLTVVASSTSIVSFVQHIIQQTTITVGVSGSNVTVTNDGSSNIVVNATAIPLAIDGN